jgi:hypothetical protein
METYVLIAFWIHVAGLVIRLVNLTSRTFPHTETKSLGAYAAEAIIALAFTIWAGIVLWAN